MVSLVTPTPGEPFLTDADNTNQNGVGIVNSTATAGPTNYEVCQRTGRKVSRGTLKREWTGLMVAPEVWEARHPLDRVRGRAIETPRGSPSPEPAPLTLPTSYLTTRVQFLPEHDGATLKGDFYSAVAAAPVLTNIPATFSSFTVCWRGRMGLSKQRIVSLGNQTTHGVGIARFSLTFSGVLYGGRVSCSSFFDPTTLQFGIGNRLNPVGSVPASPYGGDIFGQDTDWMILVTGDGATGRLEIWQYDYGAALAWEQRTGERLATRFWKLNSAQPGLVPSTGMTIADAEIAACGAQNVDTQDVLGAGAQTPAAFAYNQTALISLHLSATDTAFVDMETQAGKRAMLGAVAGFGIAAPLIHFEGAASEFGTNRGNGGALAYCNGDAAWIPPDGAITDVDAFAKNPSATTDSTG